MKEYLTGYYCRDDLHLRIVNKKRGVLAHRMSQSFANESKLLGGATISFELASDVCMVRAYYYAEPNKRCHSSNTMIPSTTYNAGQISLNFASPIISLTPSLMCQQMTRYSPRA
jgi:hypothetical protein